MSEQKKTENSLKRVVIYDISQGNAATMFRSGKINEHHFIANLLLMSLF